MTDLLKFAQKQGLLSSEFEFIANELKRTPTIEEIGVFSSLWSEHCGYKYSSDLLKRLPATGKNVLAGPGENAGAILIDADNAVVFKIESHNHPSAIAPFHGAATGVGGILRDVFTMGARPVAIFDSLHFSRKNKFLQEKVIEGISFYGNCVGVPTVGGEFDTDESYCDLPLVNVMAVGLCKKDELIFTHSALAGAAIVSFGAKTGRDGIRGAIFASDTEYQDIGAIQIADPFFEKLLIEACLEIAKSNVVLSMQDMGAAGLTSSCAEMAYKADLGADIDLDKLHIREKGISAFDILLSETQERMLAIVKKEKIDTLAEILKKWDIEYAVIGEMTKDKRFKVHSRGKKVVDLALDLIEGKIPRYSVQSSAKSISSREILHNKVEFSKLLSCFTDFITEITVNYHEIYERYDYMVGNQTVIRPGNSAAVIKVDGADIALAITTDSNSLYSSIDAFTAAGIILSEAIRNICAVGARPVGITDCLNFAKPSDAQVFYEFRQTIMGLSEAATAFDLPVVSGNVSFYNENTVHRIKATPVFGVVGVVENYIRTVDSSFKNPDARVYEIGENNLEFGGSRVQKFLTNGVYGSLPRIDFELEKRHNKLIRQLISAEKVLMASDISSGGIIRTILNSLDISDDLAGFSLSFEFTEEALKYITSETQARYLIEIDAGDEEYVIETLRKSNIPFHLIGSPIKEKKLIFKAGAEVILK